MARTLAELAAALNDGADFDAALAEILEDAAAAGSARRWELVRDEPPLVAAVTDAYLAGVAEHLCLEARMHAPAWTEGEARFLHRPYFGGGEGDKAMLLRDSPVAFRRRLLFVRPDTLTCVRG
jgi:hypothetical protein